MQPAFQKTGSSGKGSLEAMERKGSFGKGGLGALERKGSFGKELVLDAAEFAQLSSPLAVGTPPRQRPKTGTPKALDSGAQRQNYSFDPDLVPVHTFDLESRHMGPVQVRASHTPHSPHAQKRTTHDAWIPSVQASDLVDRTPSPDYQGGSLVGKLVAQPAPNNRLGKLLNQLQILGMDKVHLERLKRQLIAAVGDDTGKKLRLLQQAVHKLVTDRSYPALPKVATEERGEEISQEDAEAAARSVTTYEPSGYYQWVQEEDAVRPDETRLRPKHSTQRLGENHDLMLGGIMQRPVAAVEALFEHEMGKPMLSAAVTMEMPDYIGATQLEAEDKLNHRFRLLPKQEEQTVASSKADQFRDLRNVQKTGPKKVQTGVMSNIHHPYENAKAEEMKKRVFNGGRCNPEQEGRAPCPGTDFWRSLVVAATDPSKAGSCGGNMLLPPLQLKIPESVCFTDIAGGTFMGFYTEPDGFVYRGILPKDAAAEWLSRMRRARIRRMSRRKPYAVLPKEPLYVCRLKQGEMSGNEVRSITIEADLKASMNEANPLQLTLWQGFLRSRGIRAKIHRVMYSFDGGGEESGHYMLSSTAQMGAAEAAQGGFFCLSNDLEGTKAAGRATVINNVQPGALPDQVEAAVQLALFALHVFPYRKDRFGKLKQRYPRFAAERIAVDWLVDREGVWHFSQVYAFHARRLQAKGGIFLGEKPSMADEALNETISLLERHLDYIKAALDSKPQATKPTPPELSHSKSGMDPFSEASAADLNGMETPTEEGSVADGGSSDAGRTWAERSQLRLEARSRSRESIVSRQSNKSNGFVGLPGASNVYAPPLDTICRLAKNPRMQKTGSRLLRDVVVDRVPGDQTYKAAKTATPAGGGRAMAALDKRLNTLILSSHACPNPINDATLQRRLGGSGEENYEKERPVRAQSALPRSQSFTSRKATSSRDMLFGHGKQGFSRPPRPVSAAPIMTSAAMTELKHSITAAASALGHPI